MFIFIFLLLLTLFSLPLIYSTGNILWLLKNWRSWSTKQKMLSYFVVATIISIIIYDFFSGLLIFFIWRIIWRLERKNDSKVSIKWTLIWSFSFILVFLIIYFFKLFNGLQVFIVFFLWWIKERDEHRGNITNKKIFKTFVLPVYFYFLTVGFLYAYYCEEYRKVNGIGDDFWHVPLGKGYSFGIVDAIEEGAIYNKEDIIGDELNEVVKINIIDKNVFVQRKDNFYFLFNIDSKEIRKIDIKAPEWNNVKLLSSHEFYKSQRWKLIDKVIFIFTLIPFVLFFIYWWRKNKICSF